MKNRVRIHRVMRNLNQRKLGDLCGCSQQEISAIERGDVTPTVYVALRLSQALGAKVEELFYIE